MSAQSTASRASSGRCAACNRRTEAWVCSGCSFSSDYYSAKFGADRRSVTATTVGKRGMYSRPTNGHIEVDISPLTRSEREKLRAEFEREHPDCRIGKENYEDFIASHKWKTVYRPVYNHIHKESDPRRWCDDCLAYCRHRQGCELIEIEGTYVGGYQDDGLRRTDPRFNRLKDPTSRWQAIHYRQHARAVRRRWIAFVASWTSIGIDVFTRAISAASPTAIQIRGAA